MAVNLTIPDEGSHHLLVVAVDKAGNASPATYYTFHVGTAGLVSPLPGEEVGHQIRLAVAGPSDLAGVTFQHRATDAQEWSEIPAAEVTTAAGTAVTWPATIAEGALSGLVWGTKALPADGALQIRARFEGPDSPAPSEPVTVTLNRVDVLTDPVDIDAIAEPDTAESYALQTAEDRADASPDALAPPYLAADTGKITAPVTDTAAAPEAAAPIQLTDIPVDQGSDDGSLESVEAQDGTNAEDGEADPVATQDRTITPVTEKVGHSHAELTSITDEVLLLTDEVVPGVSQLVTASVDAENNRVVVEVAAENDAVADALGSRYGADTVALRVSPQVEALRTTATRYTYVSPYKGGAAFSSNATTRCTTAFPWTHEGKAYMLSAGHCTTGNGYMDSWSPALTYALVSYDNWNNSKGSVKVNGKSYYSGDLVTAKMIENKYTVSARIYKGGPKGSETRRVQNRWTTRSQPGQQFCHGGSTSGEVCGWKVVGGRMTIEYSDGLVIRNVTYGEKSSGSCNNFGDSGSPVYTVLSNGHVYAKGVVSGGSCGGWGWGSDGNGDGFNDDGDCSDATDYDCSIIFTDIKLAEDALPGVVKKW